jgi:hypothetical protein
MWIVKYLIQNPNCTLSEIETSTRTAFPNLRTPSRKLIIECLNSYGDEFETGWRLKETDSPQKRKTDLSQMANTLVLLGEKLGLTVTQPDFDNQPYIWEKPLGKQKHHFYISVSALLGKFLLEQNPLVERNLIIIPGGRSNLVMFKLKQDPRFQKIVENNWQFVKFRQIRQLSQSTNLTLEYFETQLGLDPLTYQETQLRMF